MEVDMSVEKAMANTDKMVRAVKAYPEVPQPPPRVLQDEDEFEYDMEVSDLFRYVAAAVTVLCVICFLIGVAVGLHTVATD
jgi:hypothetical protein